MYAADAHHPRKSLEDKLQALYLLRSGPSIDLTIREPYKKLLAALGNPHENLPPVIHVAGTNGKGSVTAMLRAVFEAAGYRVHVYTSPHLVRFNERIVLAGREIDDQMLEDMLDETVAANNGGALTFFEITTALAFAAFARAPADILLLETGLGGRLDCTNMVERPLATVITRIGYDHMEYLGETLQQIAAEKAGIMKQGVPCVIGPQIHPETRPVFEEKAKLLHSPLFHAATNNAPPTNMIGPHQLDNAATVIACLQQIKGFDLPETAIRQGLMNVRWPGRLQQIPRKNLPRGWELWVDGGHNEGAAKALAAQAQLWRLQDGKPLHIVLGMMQTKDPAAFLAPLAPYAASITLTRIPGEPLAHDPREVARTLKPLGLRLRGGEESIWQHVDNICKSESPTGRILITGSLYLTGKVLQIYDL